MENNEKPPKLPVGTMVMILAVIMGLVFLFEWIFVYFRNGLR
ncbi:MAG: hypothetical protein U0X76_11815 [Bacteroidia bacterium]